MAIDSHTTGRFELVDEVPDRTAEPYRDDEVMQLLDDAIDTVIICRGGCINDAGAQLTVIASLYEELDARLPEAIFEARCQDYRWREIATRSAMPESTIRNRYGFYVTCRKEMPESFD